MKILIFNQDWFAQELRQMGHCVLTCGTAMHLEHHLTSSLRHIEDLLHELSGKFQPDRIVWLDNSAPLHILGLEDCQIPTLFYSVDTHHHYGLHSYLADSFDHILIAQRDFMPHFSRRDTPYSWMPLWAPQYIETSAQKKFGATFVGTLNPRLNPERVAFFEELQKLIPIHIAQGHYPSIFPYAEMIVNQSVKGDLNFRVFEAMMCGAMLLTERANNGLLEIFRDNEHLATYTPRDPRDAADKVSHYLSNTSLMREIAEAGRTEILARHTARHRAIELHSILANLSKRPLSPQRYFGCLMNASILSTFMEETNRAMSAELSVVALEYVEKALDQNTPPDITETAQVLRACLRHDILNSSERGSKIIEAFATTFPQLSLFSLLQVRSLLNAGKTLEAHKVAETISHAPAEVIFAQAEEAAAVVMK